MVDSVDEIPAGREDEYILRSTDYLLRSEAVNNNAKLVCDYFYEKVLRYVKEVLAPIWNIKYHLIREGLRIIR